MRQRWWISAARDFCLASPMRAELVVLSTTSTTGYGDRRSSNDAAGSIAIAGSGPTC